MPFPTGGWPTWWSLHLAVSGYAQLGPIDPHLAHRVLSSQVWLHKEAPFPHTRSGVPVPYWPIHEGFESSWDQFAKWDPVRSYWPPTTPLQRQQGCINRSTMLSWHTFQRCLYRSFCDIGSEQDIMSVFISKWLFKANLYFYWCKWKPDRGLLVHNQSF